MKKIFLSILLLISLIKLNAIKIDEFETGQYVLKIKNDTSIDQNIQIDGNLFIVGKNILIKDELLLKHKYPTLTIEEDSEIIVTGATYFKNINIKNKDKIKCGMLIFIP